MGAAVYTLKVDLPTMSPAAGTYTSAQSVALSTTTSGATIRYPTDGTDPTATSPLNTAPISVSTGTTLKARGFRAGWTDSAVGSAVYGFNYGTLTPPTLSPSPGVYVTPVSVTLTASPGETVHYALDGSDPAATGSPIYSSPINLTQTTTVQARSFKEDWTPSPITTGTYEVKVATPTLCPGGGTYNDVLTVTAACTTPGATRC